MCASKNLKHFAISVPILGSTFKILGQQTLLHLHCLHNSTPHPPLHATLPCPLYPYFLSAHYPSTLPACTLPLPFHVPYVPTPLQYCLSAYYLFILFQTLYLHSTRSHLGLYTLLTMCMPAFFLMSFHFEC